MCIKKTVFKIGTRYSESNYHRYMTHFVYAQIIISCLCVTLLNFGMDVHENSVFNKIVFFNLYRTVGVLAY